MSFVNKQQIIMSTISDPVQSLLNGYDWAFFFDANQGITTDGSGDVSEWVDAKNSISLPFSTGNRPAITTNGSGQKYLSFTGSEFSDKISITEDVGAVLFLAKPTSSLSVVCPVLNMYRDAYISFGNVSGAIANEDLSVIHRDASDNIGIYASAIGYNRTVFHSISMSVDINRPKYIIDSGSLSTLDGTTFTAFMEAGQQYTDFQVGRRSNFAQFYIGDIAYIIGMKGGLNDTNLEAAHNRLIQILTNY